MDLFKDYASYDDEKLIRLIAQARVEALAQLYDRYHRLVFSLALSIVGDRAIAEEITLDVFMRVWQKAETYRSDIAKVSTWIIYIARHHAIDVLRHQLLRPDHHAFSWDDVTSDLSNPMQDPEELAEISMRRERVRAALVQLPVDQKRALLLAYFGGYTQRQIAEILRQPLGTIKTRLRLALQKLRDLLQEEQELGDKSEVASSTYNISEDDS